MKRDELLTKLAMELADWPNDLKQCESVKLPGLAYWNCGRVTGDVVVWPDRKMKGAGLVIGASDWLQRRAELINCPPDSEAPAWATHKAQTKFGVWEWYEGEPQIDEAKGFWRHDKRGNYCHKGNIPAGHDWRTTPTKINREDDTMTPQEERAWVEKDQQLNGHKNERVAEWPGEGLPPIGVKCCYIYSDGDLKEGEITHHLRNGRAAIIEYDDKGWDVGTEEAFQPVVIDRDRWIEQARKAVDDATLIDSDSLYGAIWDAGLGKLPN